MVSPRRLLSAELESTVQNEKNGKNKADPISNGEKGRTVNSLRTSEEQPDQFERYPDVVDLAEMDYSPARRKSPIHN
ncbi:hypothetical protein TIFTF001_016619 [Ficus carica]|uniref:Uncharacterized protein n=1 Tax=Ficus carica TaxID=3494 RepID=A0AA88D7K3_FICCA|nr:hypothetical protein TIFTF001_016619 [Ficus carica]